MISRRTQHQRHAPILPGMDQFSRTALLLAVLLTAAVAALTAAPVARPAVSFTTPRVCGFVDRPEGGYVDKLARRRDQGRRVRLCEGVDGAAVEIAGRSRPRPARRAGVGLVYEGDLVQHLLRRRRGGARGLHVGHSVRPRQDEGALRHGSARRKARPGDLGSGHIRAPVPRAGRDDWRRGYRRSRAHRARCSYRSSTAKGHTVASRTSARARPSSAFRSTSSGPVDGHVDFGGGTTLRLRAAERHADYGLPPAIPAPRCCAARGRRRHRPPTGRAAAGSPRTSSSPTPETSPTTTSGCCSCSGPDRKEPPHMRYLISVAIGVAALFASQFAHAAGPTKVVRLSIEPRGQPGRRVWIGDARFLQLQHCPCPAGRSPAASSRPRTTASVGHPTRRTALARPAPSSSSAASLRRGQTINSGTATQDVSLAKWAKDIDKKLDPDLLLGRARRLQRHGEPRHGADRLP